jgi:two-component system phosphate regulon sensor histidine kinase PhoR
MTLRLLFAAAFAGFGVLITLVPVKFVSAALLFVAVFSLFLLRERDRERRLLAQKSEKALKVQLSELETELAIANQQLIAQNAKLLATVESLEAALVVCDASGIAQFVNPAAAFVLRGATPILGENVGKAFHEGDLETLSLLFSNLNTSSQARKLEIRRDSDVLSAQFTPLVGEKGEFLGAMLIVADVTAQRELDRMKTDFVGYVAHELRTPLTTILGYANLLDKGAERFNAAELHQISEVLARHCRRMNRLVSDLLDLSRLEAGQDLYIDITEVDLRAMCHRLTNEQSAFLNPTPPLQIVVEVPELKIFVDADRLEQIIVNLLSNAVKYSPDGGKITLSANQSDDETEIEVKDEGMGLTQEQVERMFSKFYRTKDAQMRGIKGNGLGLNLVKQLAEAHGGRIEVESGRDRGEKGATFRVFLPVKPIHEPSQRNGLRIRG